MVVVGSLASRLIWRAVGWPLLRSIGTVSVAVAALIIAVIAVEQGPYGSDRAVRTIAEQLPLIMMGMTPWMVGVGVAFGWVKMESRGEVLALHASGLGTSDVTRVALVIGTMVGAVAIGAFEVWLPIFELGEGPSWVWTDSGPQRTRDGIVVLLNDGGRILADGLNGDALALANPRLAPFDLLSHDRPGAVGTEWWSRLARWVACAGFALLAATAVRTGRPMLTVMLVGGVLVALDLVLWTMGSHGHIAPWLAGSASAWMWLVPWLWLSRQPEI